MIYKLAIRIIEMENDIKSIALKKEDVQIAADIKEKLLNKDVIDPNLIQIRASSEELNRRIESFIERKRQQVNTVNVQEFCRHRSVHY